MSKPKGGDDPACTGGAGRRDGVARGKRGKASPRVVVSGRMAVHGTAVVGETGGGELFNYERAVRRCFDSTEVLDSMTASLGEETELLRRYREGVGAGLSRKELVRLAHRLKNTVVYLGSERVVIAVRELERAAERGPAPRMMRLLDAVILEAHLLWDAIRRTPRPCSTPGHGR